jgi:hypothetical protein
MPMSKHFRRGSAAEADVSAMPWLAWLDILPLWQLDIAELTGHNLESRGREEVNRLLKQGWRLLHIYTLKYKEEDVWRERPMAILGRPRRKRAESTRRKDRGQGEGTNSSGDAGTLLFPDFGGGDF